MNEVFLRFTESFRQLAPLYEGAEIVGEKEKRETREKREKVLSSTACYRSRSACDVTSSHFPITWLQTLANLVSRLTRVLCKGWPRPGQILPNLTEQKALRTGDYTHGEDQCLHFGKLCISYRKKVMVIFLQKRMLRSPTAVTYLKFFQMWCSHI